MASQRVTRIAGARLRRLCRTLLLPVLLPLLLLCAHQGAFLHELSHYQSSQTEHEDARHADRSCELCLAFAAVAAIACPALPPLLLLAGLSFLLVPALPVLARAAMPPARRSRGPPVHR